MSRWWEFYAAVYGIIKNDSGKILMQRRANTGFNDGILQLPSWHLEWEETYFQALKREMKEEINIDIDDSDIVLSHVWHRIHKWDRVYYDIYLEITKYRWEIKNNEPDKCSELDFFDIHTPDFTPYNKIALKHIQNKVVLSEITL